MALKSCRECKSMVSSEAKICPNCGISKPIKSSSKWLWIMFGLIVLFILISPKNNNPKNAVAQNQSTLVTQSQNLAQVADLKVALDVEVLINDQKPVVRVKTNLPENTNLMGNLANPITEGGTGYFGQSQASVTSHNLAEIGPFSNNGEPLPPGFYMLTISMGSLAQPQSVQSTIGINGERLKGNNIYTLVGVPGRIIWQRFTFEMMPDGSIVDLRPSKNTAADSSLVPVE